MRFEEEKQSIRQKKYDSKRMRECEFIKRKVDDEKQSLPQKYCFRFWSKAIKMNTRKVNQDSVHAKRTVVPRNVDARHERFRT